MSYDLIDNLEIGTLIISIDESLDETETLTRFRIQIATEDDTLKTFFMPATSTCRELRVKAIDEAMNILDQIGHYCDSVYLDDRLSDTD